MFRFGLMLCLFIIVRCEIDEDFTGVSNELKSNSQKNDSSELFVDTEMCHTKECYRVASNIWQSMNHSVNPCENFYEYACGNFATSNPIPSRELTWGTFPKLRRKVKFQLLKLVREPINSTDIMPVKQAKKFYRSCLYRHFIAARGLKQISAFLTQIGGWPLIMEPDEWDVEKIEWQKINQFYSRLIFMSPFYQIRVTNDPRKSNLSESQLKDSKRIIKILPPVIPLERMTVYSGKIFNELVKDMYNDGTYSNYTEYIAKILAHRRSAEINPNHLKKNVNKLIELEKKFLSIKDNEDSEAKYVTIDELQEMYENASDSEEKAKIDWKKLITEHFAEANVELNGEEIIAISNTKHFEILSEILQNTDKVTIANYMHWHFVSQMLPYSTYFQQNLRNNLFKDKEGIKKPKKRKYTCLENLAMPLVLAHMYVKEYVDNDALEAVQKIFVNIQQEMSEHIQNADWLNEESRNMELEKMAKMRAFIGVSKVYYNEAALTALYRGVVIGNQFMDNVISLKQFNSKFWLRLLKMPYSKREFAFPLLVNAFYRRNKNAISVSIADLQAPLFSVLQPNTVNYGELGTLIGHEISHGFDNNGIKFDQEGKKVFWPEDFSEIYSEKIQCYVDQYRNDSINNDSTICEQKRVLPENVADSLGLDAVFEALQKLEEEKQSLRLPGFEHWSNDKIFFLSYANLWCSSLTPDFQKFVKGKLGHSKATYRVNAPLQNSVHFAKTFNCPEDSRMNPKEKCKLW